MIENIFLFSNNILNAMLVAVVGALAAFIIGEIIIRLLKKIAGKTFSVFVATLVRLAIGIWTLKIILDLSSAAGLIVILVTVITGAFAIGSERFASDIIAGVKLFTTRPYEVGHHVLLDGHQGRVKAMELTTTTLENVLGDHIIIRNSDVVDGTIVNQSALPGQLITVLVPLPTGEDLEIATRVIVEALQDFSDQDDPRFAPSVTSEEISFGYVKLQVRAYVSEKVDYGPDKVRLMIQAVSALKKNGIALKN